MLLEARLSRALRSEDRGVWSGEFEPEVAKGMGGRSVFVIGRGEVGGRWALASQ